MRRALILDRDGVINVDRGYVYRQDEFEFVYGIFDLCRAASALEYVIVVVTNQAGIGRGYYTEEDFVQISEWMCAEFRARGISIANVYHCPFHPELGVGVYRRDSIDRKPGPGMIERAAHDFDVDLAGSILVGDRVTDIEAGAAAGVGCNLLYDPAGKADEPSSTAAPTWIVRTLREVEAFLSPPVSGQPRGGGARCTS
jgi:D-glycero-D-manno-heptose 1,7-bisphosphate phosphatase